MLITRDDIGRYVLLRNGEKRKILYPWTKSKHGAYAELIGFMISEKIKDGPSFINFTVNINGECSSGDSSLDVVAFEDAAEYPYISEEDTKRYVKMVTEDEPKLDISHIAADGCEIDGSIWLPIEQAPKDGSWFVAMNENKKRSARIIEYDVEKSGFDKWHILYTADYIHEHRFAETFTHFLPLNPPMKQKPKRYKLRDDVVIDTDIMDGCRAFTFFRKEPFSDNILHSLYASTFNAIFEEVKE